MGSLVEVDASSHLVPVVDIAPFLTDPQSPEAGAVVDAVRQACTTSGFFAITGHGLAQQLQRDLLAAARAFFSLDLDEKKKLDATRMVGRRGYDVLASQSYHADVRPDLKEGFYVGHDLPAHDPHVRAGRFFMGPNVWPDEGVLAPQRFRGPVEAYFDAVHLLSLKVLQLVACTLPYGAGVFDEFTAGNHTVAVLRLLHYPPAPASASPSSSPEDQQRQRPQQLGAGAHTDFGAITLLLQDEHAGLEVLDPKTSRFVPVDPIPDAFVFNVGDMLSVWTDGLYKSSVHRVINKAPTDRYSAAFFYDGALDCPLTPLHQAGKVQEAENVLTVEKHLLRRILESYGNTGTK
ncbi:hypothetical protein A1O3_01767 [Capronia epimyces CBS 606.96]|uniref:Fe2OG dioxygenase domain-containing protein n=1 Tax=Capronia epimyces CBS 606.96 TaxID=1182542 RepID=W9YU41_9EURO|nr:uncharacterized protein A1O3_01767 [Capronia epimyces CBS 606.96]EXJ93210.1 hypothetical protein A1O3_01767 [Capronia epimyces CBS 606.96]